MLQGNKLNHTKYNGENQKQIDFLQKHVRNIYTKDIANWQYANGEYTTGLYLTEENNEYIASQGMIPVALRFENKVFDSAKSESSFLLPAFRGKGIFDDLYFYTMEAAEQDEIQIVWGFTELSSVWRKKLKFEVYDGLIHESELQIRFFKCLKSVWESDASIRDKTKKTVKCFISFVKTRPIRNSKKHYSAEQLNIENTDEVMKIVNVYEQWALNHSHFLKINFDENFLHWRIKDNPLVKYKVIGIKKNNTLVGYGIINARNNKVYLLDLIVPKEEDLNHCLNEILYYLKKENLVYQLTYWASHKNDYSKQIHELLKQLGANAQENNFMNFVIKKTKKCKLESFAVENIYINGLWTEGFKI